MDVISLLKLLKDLLPEEVYRKILRLLLDLMESEDCLALRAAAQGAAGLGAQILSRIWKS